MTDMSSRKLAVFRPRFMLATLLAAFATFGQDEEAYEPAVDTSAALEPAVDSSASVVDEREIVEPAVSPAVLASDVTRQQTGSRVMDRLGLGRTEIPGNQELPKVLYIVPWKKSDPGDLLGRPVNTLLDEVLAPIDREEFVRQVDYYGDLYGNDEQE